MGLRRAPGRSPNYVDRPRLTDLFGADGTTVVVAPAGTGKTTAAAAWARGQECPVHWIDAGERSDVLAGLWLDVADSLGTTLPEGDRTSTSTPLGDVVFAVVEALEASSLGRQVLVIDDAHRLDSGAAATALATFLRHRPADVHVVLLSRRPLVVDALRSTVHLREIDAEDVRFTLTESRELVEVLAPGCEEVYAEAVMGAADGWAMALVLGCGARRHDDLDSAISHVRRSVDRYVLRQLLDEEEPSLVDFLVDVSIVDRVTAGLANAITERADSASLIERAEDRGLFVTRIGMRGWYELHPAVRAALRREGERRDDGRAIAARRRAAVWLDEADEVVAALEQWIAAGEPVAALQLLARRQVDLYDAGLAHAIQQFTERLSTLFPATDLAGMIDLAWCRVLVDRRAFLDAVADARWLSEQTADPDPVLDRRLHALLGIASLIDGDLTESAVHARTAVDAYTTWWSDPIVKTSWNDLARTVALDERWDDGSREVREIAVVLRRQPERSVVYGATRALGEALAGRPVDALRIAAGVRSSGVVSQLAFPSVELRLAEILAHHEIGDAPSTHLELAEVVDNDVAPSSYGRALAARELVEVHLARGAFADAESARERLEVVVHDEFSGPTGRSWLARATAAVALAAGDAPRADHWATRVTDDFWQPLWRARVAAERGDVTGGRRLLDDARPRSPRHEVLRLLTGAGLAAQRDEATELVERAAMLAEANNMLQTVSAVGGVLELVEVAAWRLPDAWVERVRRSASTQRSSRPLDVTLVEPLTARERDVLRFLPSRLTIREIAAELYVSVNTLKFHLKVIYRKLGVNSRAEAAEIARSWGRVDGRDSTQSSSTLRR